jgi:hypothetical protein
MPLPPTTAVPDELLPVLPPELEELPLEGLLAPVLEFIPSGPLPASVVPVQLAAEMHAQRRAARPRSAEIRMLFIYDQWP